VPCFACPPQVRTGRRVAVCRVAYERGGTHRLAVQRRDYGRQTGSYCQRPPAPPI
jgi:hypothetical protein